QARSGNQRIDSGSSGEPASEACFAHASANFSSRRSLKRPVGGPSWVASAMKRGNGRAIGGIETGSLVAAGTRALPDHPQPVPSRAAVEVARGVARADLEGVLARLQL